MEGTAEAAATQTPARNFSQVVFSDIPPSYPPSSSITCGYTLSDSFQPHSRDWVGIFKVGWSTTKDYHTFVWVDLCSDVAGGQPVKSQAVFKDYYLPKDEVEFYQFCYVDNGGQVRGASTPFCFRNQEEQSLDCSPDDELLVITTQEQVDQSVREKSELQKEVKQIMEERELLKNALQREQQEAANLKAQTKEDEKQKHQLLRELEELKEESKNLKSTVEQQLKEMERVKEEMVNHMTEQAKMQECDAADQKRLGSDGASAQNETRAQANYDRALIKINQLKEERAQLRGKVEAQGDEITALNFKLRGTERELLKMKDSVQLLEVDLQSSQEKKERLSGEVQRLQIIAHNVDEVTRENKELCRRLSDQGTPEKCGDEDLRERCHTLAKQLQEAQEKMAEEREVSRNAKRREELLQMDVQQLKQQLANAGASCAEAEKIGGKYELMLREAREAITDKDAELEDNKLAIMLLGQEKEELNREIQSLNSDIEGLRKVCAELQAAATADLLDTSCHATSIPRMPPLEAHEEIENVYENIDDVTDMLDDLRVCRHCQVSFPLMTLEELEQHEQSHQICPICMLLCDDVVQSVFEDHVYSHEL